MSLSLTEVLAWLCWVGFLVKIDISVCFERLGFVLFIGGLVLWLWRMSCVCVFFSSWAVDALDMRKSISSLKSKPTTPLGIVSVGSSAYPGTAAASLKDQFKSNIAKLGGGGS